MLEVRGGPKEEEEEHYQWNVDIWGMEGIEADAELLVMVHMFKSVGLTHDDVVVRISERKVLEEVLGSLGIEGDSFTKTCVIVDKMDKLPEETVSAQLSDLGISDSSITTIQSVLSVKDLPELRDMLSPDSMAVIRSWRGSSSFSESSLRDVRLDNIRRLGPSGVWRPDTGPVFEAPDRGGARGELHGEMGGQ